MFHRLSLITLWTKVVCLLIQAMWNEELTFTHDHTSKFLRQLLQGLGGGEDRAMPLGPQQREEYLSSKACIFHFNSTFLFRPFLSRSFVLHLLFVTSCHDSFSDRSRHLRNVSPRLVKRAATASRRTRTVILEIDRFGIVDWFCAYTNDNGILTSLCSIDMKKVHRLGNVQRRRRMFKQT
jgi:hypothetical protein